jgi:hypothetical protein
MRAISMSVILAVASCSGTSPTDAGGYDPLPPRDSSGPPIEAPLET